MTINEAIAHAREVAVKQRSASAEWLNQSNEEGSIEEEISKGCEKCAQEHEQLAKWLEELQQYQEIGTIEKFRVAAEKQKPKRPSESRCPEKTHYRCPNCGFIPFTIYKNGRSIGNKPAFCERCGQEIDWSDINAEIHL